MNFANFAFLEHDTMIKGHRQYMFCDSVLYARNLEEQKGAEEDINAQALTKV